MTKYTTAKLHMKIENALREFFRKDACLLSLKVNERSITHKLAEYLQRQFADLDVDCEYNRHGIEKKELSFALGTTATDCEHAKTVYPDIIVHKRGRDSSNKLVIEVKKSTGDNVTHDKKKLRVFTKPRGGYEYQLGLFLEFDVGEQSGLKHAECYQGVKRTLSPCPHCKSLLNSFKPSVISTTTARQS